ncbi:MAG: tetratricopeptide repeat protein [Gemmatimonadales bacterium]|jgi:tetratricopeptide (TPR) repeat protein
MNEENRPVNRWRRLRQHPAFQAAAVYVGGGWALIQVADIFIPNPTVVRWLGVVLAIGFLAVVGGAWISAARGSGSGAAEDVTSATANAGQRRRRHYAYAAAVALVGLGALFWWLRPSILGAVAPDAQVIAVLPFNTSGPAVEYLGEGVVDLLSPNFDEVGAIRTVDPRTVLHRWRQRATDGGLDLEGSLKVGRDVEAGSVVLGSVVAAGPEVRMRAQLYSVRGVELAQAQVEGPADSVLALLDDLAVALLRDIWIAREPVPNLRVSGITTGDIGAIRAYLKGQQYYRRSDWDSALVAFQQAVDADSTFALAHYRLGLTYGWNTRHGGFGSRAARRHAELAQRYSERLPARERTLVAAHALFEDGEVAAHDSMTAYVRRYPDDPEGWYMLGDVRYHAFPLLALEEEQLFDPFDRVIELDPTLAPAIIHPLELSLAYNDSVRYRRYLTAMESLVDSTEIAPFRLAAAVWDAPDSLDGRLAADPRAQRLGGYILRGLYRSKRSPEPMLEGFREVAFASRRSGNPEPLGMYALVLSSFGHLDEARAVFDTLWAVAPDRQWPYLRLLPVLAGYADSSFLGPILKALDGPAPDPQAEQFFYYARMLYALSAGRSEEARAVAEQALATVELSAKFENFFRAALGWARIIEGDTVAGLEQLQSGLEAAGYIGDLQASGPLRFALAVIQASRDETRAEGIRRLKNGLWFGDVVYFAPAYLHQAQALEQAGERVGAAQAYAQFIHLWEGADRELQAQVEAARRALERLSAERVD